VVGGSWSAKEVEDGKGFLPLSGIIDAASKAENQSRVEARK